MRVLTFEEQKMWENKSKTTLNLRKFPNIKSDRQKFPMEKKNASVQLHLIPPLVVMFHSVTATKTQHVSAVKICCMETRDAAGGASRALREIIHRGSTSNTNTGRHQRGSPFYPTQLWLLLLLMSPRFRVFIPNGTKKKTDRAKGPCRSWQRACNRD